MELSMLKTFFEILESALTGIAIIVGGFWTYKMFVKKREKYPRASINHCIIEKNLNNGKKLVHLFIEIKNIGSVLLSLERYDVRISQVIPLDNELAHKISKNDDPVDGEYHEIFWPLLFNRLKKFQGDDICELEPSEIEKFNFDFVIDDGIKTIQVYCYFKNKSKPGKEIGWNCTTFHDLK